MGRRILLVSGSPILQALEPAHPEKAESTIRNTDDPEATHSCFLNNLRKVPVHSTKAK